MTDNATEKASAMRERLREEGRREMYARMRPHLELLRRQNDALNTTLWALHELDPDYVPQPASAPMDNATRTALSDALAGATVEQLRSGADYHVESARLLDLCAWPHDPQPNADLAARHRRMAALALAVAEWDERPTRLSSVDNSWDDDGGQMSWALRIPMTMAYEHHAHLPAALAALLRGGA